MRVRMLRNLGKNLPHMVPESNKEWRAAAVNLEARAHTLVEGTIVDVAGKEAEFLKAHGLAESVKAEDEQAEAAADRPRAEQPRGKPQKFANGAHVEVTDKTLPSFKQTGTVQSAAEVGGSGDPWMYTVKRDDGTTFKASEGQLKKA